jgi:hypothetical protein
MMAATHHRASLRTRDSIVRMIVALPCVALAVASAWWFVGRLAGGGLWPPDRVTLGEAIATRNNAEALRLIMLGASPNQPTRVRAGLLSDGYDVVVTPLEAAVGAQRADSLRMLLASGAVLDGRELRVLRCYERVRRDAGVREILDAHAARALDGAQRAATDTSHQPPASVEVAADCTGVRLPVDRVE